MNRFLIAGTGSGCGKTTMTCAILSALQMQGRQVSAFKCGPDYIDPMFHRQVTGIPAHNLDGFFCKPATLCELLHTRSAGCDTAVIEGVMGYFDGADGSARHVAQITQTPAVLVIDCKGMQESIGAVMHGFLHYQSDSRIAGFLFNRLPLRLIPAAKRLCEEMRTGYFGCLPPHDLTFGSRHLGLVTAEEIRDLRERLDALGTLAQEHICIDRLLALQAPDLPGEPPSLSKPSRPPVIAVAKDRAFCFHYAENLEMLEEMGCTLRYFSPLTDPALPAADGLILCGGYPELYAQALSENAAMRMQIREHILAGMPVIAECGGFLYLHDSIRTEQGESFPMAGIFPGEASSAGRLGRFGYITMTAREDSLLFPKGGQLRAHEFHYWDVPDPGHALEAVKPDGRHWPCGHVSRTMYAGFPHLYFYADPRIAERFVQACAAYGGSHGTHQTAQTCG